MRYIDIKLFEMENVMTMYLFFYKKTINFKPNISYLMDPKLNFVSHQNCFPEFPTICYVQFTCSEKKILRNDSKWLIRQKISGVKVRFCYTYVAAVSDGW